MKILICGAYFPDRPSGSARTSSGKAKELVRRGEDVWMLTAADPLLPEYELRDGLHILRYVPEKVASWNPARAFSHQKAAKAVLERHLPKVDAILGHSLLSTQAALELYGDSVRSCYTLNSPATMEMAIVWRNSSLLRRIAAPVGLMMIKRIEAECLRRSRVITAESQYTIDCIGRIHGKKIAERLRLIPASVDTSRFVPAEDRESLKVQLGWPTDIPILFTLRRLEWRMGLDRLLDASHRLVSEGLRFHLMIGGTGSLRGRLEEQVRTLGLSKSVTFLGRVEDRQLPLAYAACDAFVLPTAELECFGLIALEALSAGRPVLATPVGAIPEVVGKFESGWLARSSEPEDIADLLRRFLEGKLPDHSSAELHDRVYREYDRVRVVSEFIEAAVSG
jgi:glycosyltransferase involved in cell wall biosynthesis